MPPIDWSNMFVPSVSPIEIILRGSMTYIALFILLRVILKRQSGNFGMTDLLLIVLLADAAQNSMAGDYHSVTDGILLVTTLMFWSWFLDFLAARYRWIEKFTYPNPIKLIENGNMLLRNMRKELVTTEELRSQLREKGIDDIKRVKVAYIEGDGQFSVLMFDEKESENEKDRKKTSV